MESVTAGYTVLWELRGRIPRLVTIPGSPQPRKAAGKIVEVGVLGDSGFVGPH